jgi:Protein of unknown function (DUF3467)
MAKRQSKIQIKQERQIPIIWDFPEDLVSGYATNMLVQVGEHELYVSFFETPPPVLLGQEDVTKLEGVRAECIARIIVAPERMTEFIEVLNKQLEVYQKKKAVDSKANGTK